MKFARLFSVLAVMLALAPAAFCQDAVMLLYHQEFGRHQRPAVEFGHGAHSAIIDCLRCHHDFDAYSNNRGGEGQPCVNCHDALPEDGSLSLRDAFHLQCKGCHESFISQGRRAGGVMCGECHVRK
ncbi:MAG TPA: cytochrome c3 family protein [Syntrophobacteraceae bacterium]|nr:cytochrome c3 family protein [Syntrophobacteraceae bacterium]